MGSRGAGIRHWGFRRRFLLVGLVFLAGYGALMVVARGVLDRVMVNGEIYRDVSQRQQLIADILPPPKFIVEPFLLCFRIAAEEDPTRRDDLVLRLHAARNEYKDRTVFWRGRLGPSDPVYGPLVERSEPPAEAFFAKVDTHFLPAVARSPAEAAEVLRTELLPLYVAHREAVRQAVATAKGQVEADEARATLAVEEGRRTALWVAVAVVLGIGLVGALVLRTVVVSLERLIARMRELAESEANLCRRVEVDTGDECGQLAHWINRFIGKIADLVKAVRRSSVQLTSTSTQMAATSREQESTVQAFGASTTEIAAAVQEIHATGAELLHTMDELSRAATTSAGHASKGRQGLAAMGRTMEQLQQSSASISEKLAGINEKAGEISTVVTTITKVADQTNLLSVNAAIEAEKAGEYGRGFLVVAREIRRLADQTAAATLDIERTVGEMQSAVSAGVMEMDKFADRVRHTVQDVAEVSQDLAEILGLVEQTTERFASVKDGMSSQAQGASQINDAMHALTESVQQTVLSLKEFTAAADELRSAADGLNVQLATFKLED